MHIKTTTIGIVTISMFFFSSFSAFGQAIETIAGIGATGFLSGSYAGDGGAATAANLYYPGGLAFDAGGNLYVADSRNHRIRKIDATGIITTFAGTGSTGYSGDGGAATAAELGYPESLVIDGAGNLFFADRWESSIRKISPSGIITTVAGDGTMGFAGDGGPATAAKLDNVLGIQVDAAGNLYISDWINSRVRKVGTDGVITTIAGNGSAIYSGDGGPATAAGMRPAGIFIEPSGGIIVADANNRRLRKIDAAGNITTIAGSGIDGFAGDGGDAMAAQFGFISCVTKDAAGNILVCDETNGVVRRIDSAGNINTIAGMGRNSGFSGDGGPATAARLQFPVMMTFGPSGQLFVSDLQNNRVRKIDYVSTAPTSVDVKGGNAVSIYPNPAREVLHVDQVALNTRYNLTDITGTCLLKGDFNRPDNSLSLKTLPAGAYLLQLTSPVGDTKIIKFVKEQ